MDGAGDECPYHEEVQFMWTIRHIFGPTIATLVTSRSSGSSYLNKVELQNGCLALTHANSFYTIGGSCMDTTTGKVDKNKYVQNMELATDVLFISYLKVLNRYQNKKNASIFKVV